MPRAGSPTGPGSRCPLPRWPARPDAGPCRVTTGGPLPCLNFALPHRQTWADAILPAWPANLFLSLLEPSASFQRLRSGPHHPRTPGTGLTFRHLVTGGSCLHLGAPEADPETGLGVRQEWEEPGGHITAHEATLWVAGTQSLWGRRGPCGPGLGHPRGRRLEGLPGSCCQLLAHTGPSPPEAGGGNRGKPWEGRGAYRF